jgi:hypothetical protein
LLLQAAYCDYQIGAFENFHQLVEDTLIVLRPGPKIFFQYELGFADCLKSQLLISHSFLPIKQNVAPSNKCCPEESPTNQANLGKYSPFFELSHQILFQCGSPAQDRGGFLFNVASDVDADRARLAATESRAMCF